MEGAQLCCGFGGTFSAYHEELSYAISQRKIDGIKNSSAQIIATSCPGCMIQLQDLCNRNGLDVQVIHLLHLLNQALSETTE